MADEKLLAPEAMSALTFGGVKALLDEFETTALAGSLADGWGFDVHDVEYAAVGSGSYHWIVTDPGGTRGFATVDDLDQKPWLGDSRESVFDGLRRAFDTAFALRAAGLRFVVAPIPTTSGETVRRIGARHSIALFPFVDGPAGRFGRYDPAERAALATMLAELHQATPAVGSVVRRMDLELPGRRYLESGLKEIDQEWFGGPFSEPARQALAEHVSDLRALLRLADRLSLDVARRASDWVVTHGEPHAGNLIRTDERHMLVDWDTAALAPPERDLWMLVGEAADGATIYTDETGHKPDEVAVDFFRLTWDLADLAVFTNVLRSPHSRNEDTAMAYDGLRRCVGIRDQWARLLT